MEVNMYLKEVCWIGTWIGQMDYSALAYTVLNDLC